MPHIPTLTRVRTRRLTLQRRRVELRRTGAGAQTRQAGLAFVVEVAVAGGGEKSAVGKAAAGGGLRDGGWR